MDTEPTEPYPRTLYPDEDPPRLAFRTVPRGETVSYSVIQTLSFYSYTEQLRVRYPCLATYQGCLRYPVHGTPRSEGRGTGSLTESMMPTFH